MRHADCYARRLLFSGLGILFIAAVVRGQGAWDQNEVGSLEKLNEEAGEFLRRGAGQHTDNWAVLVCTSRFWFNYRHVANALAMYRTVKRLGIPDSHIILMLADDMSCNPRNSEPGSIYADEQSRVDIYGDNIEVDYRGYEVTVENFIRVLTGRHPEGTPPSKRLRTTARSNVLIYMTGHGGDEFLKFQDSEEISSKDIGDALAQMWVKQRYNEILFMVDTCQAGTLAKFLYSPNVLAVGSSQKDQNSYSWGNDAYIGLSLVDRFTYVLLEQMDKVGIGSERRLVDILRQLDPNRLHSTPAFMTSLWQHRSLGDVLATDFFGATTAVETGTPPYPIGAAAPLADEGPPAQGETAVATSGAGTPSRVDAPASEEAKVFVDLTRDESRVRISAVAALVGVGFVALLSVGMR